MPHHDLVIIGSGSGNSLLTPELDGLDVAIVEGGTFGGTCLNVGCIPTKMFVLPADRVVEADDAHRLGVTFAEPTVDWPGIRDRIFGRIDPISAGGEAYRLGQEHTTLYRAHATFTGERRLALDDRRGGHRRPPRRRGRQPPGRPRRRRPARARPRARRAHLRHGDAARRPPAPDGDHRRRVRRLRDGARVRRARRRGDPGAARAGAPAPPRGGGVAALHRGRPAPLRPAPVDHPDVGASASATSGGSTSPGPAAPATSRPRWCCSPWAGCPNTDRLDPAAGGLEVHDDGRLVVDEQLRTTAPGVWALGDVSSAHQLKHVANHEARIVAHNLAVDLGRLAGEPRTTDDRPVPHAVFGHPQVAAFGPTAAELDDGRNARSSPRPRRSATSRTAGRWRTPPACSPSTPTPPAGSSRRTPSGRTRRPSSSRWCRRRRSASAPIDVARGQYWIHPALAEVVENALLGLPLPDPA